MFHFQSFIIVLSTFVAISTQTESFEHIITLFDHKKCIEGTLTSLLDQNIDANNNEESASIKSLLSSNQDYEKSVLSSIHELATFNEISYDYELIEEQGEPHNKEFTVTLILGDEKYDGVGGSLKKAQRRAAALALEHTDYEHPPIKLEDDTPKTPTVLLNNIGSKLAIPVKYFLLKDAHEQELKWEIKEKPFKSYVEKLNESAHDPHYKSGTPNEDPTLYGPFTVRVQVGDSSFKGTGHTIQAARHDAALNAIKGLKKESLEKSSPCMKEGSEKECKEARNALKSPVSLVYEAGQQRQMEASFEVINEAGPAHKRVFTTRCTLAHLVTEADGRSKKESKRKAAELMMERIDELPEVSDEVVIMNGMKSKKKKNKKKKIKRTQIEKMGSMLDEVFETLFPSEPKEKRETKDENKKPTKQDSKDETDRTNSKKPPKGNDRTKSATDELLELSNKINMEVQISDFKVKSKFYSFISLGIKPPVVCFGEEITKPKSKEKAAHEALIFLSNKGISYSFKKTETTQEESNYIEDDDNLYLSPFSEEKNQ